MVSLVAITLGLSLLIVLAVAAFMLVWRKRRLSTPEARYRRDMREIQLRTYVEAKPRPSRQLGADRLEGKYGNYGGLGQ